MTKSTTSPTIRENPALNETASAPVYLYIFPAPEPQSIFRTILTIEANLSERLRRLCIRHGRHDLIHEKRFSTFRKFEVKTGERIVTLTVEVNLGMQMR